MSQLLVAKTNSLEPNYKKKSELYFHDFSEFFYNVFLVAVQRVRRNIVPATHLLLWTRIMQAYPKTSIKAPRKHLKTTVKLGYLAWQLYRLRWLDVQYMEWLFLSYKGKLASYHLKALKRYIKAMPQFYQGYIDLTDADSFLRFGINGKEFICEPAGILSCERGRHPYGLIADDILKDPQKKMDISQIEKITTLFLEEIEAMPTHECHVTGTPQDEEDLFKHLDEMPDYASFNFESVLDFTNKRVLWEQKFPFEKLMSIRENIGEKAFNKEYQCAPVRGEEAFFKRAQIDAMIKQTLKNYQITETFELKDLTFGGLDIGKKSHPSHLFIIEPRIEKVDDVDKIRLVQVHSKYMDGWDYVDQIAYCRQAIERFKMGRLLYDDTRAEFEGFKERGELPEEMGGVPFTSKNKFMMATEVDKFATTDGLWLLDDQRQKRQLLTVDNDLKAITTNEGHGDCFFSLCLAVSAYLENSAINIWGA